VLLFLNIHVIANAASDPTSPITPIINVQRLAGPNRIETAIVIASQQYADKAPDAVVLATANNFADALAGSGLAYKSNAPLLLVNKSVSNSKNVLDYIAANLSQNKSIYILGGIGAVSKEISDYLTLQGYEIIRLGGVDRYETNQKIVDYLNVPKGTSIVIATGGSFADALSISSIADIKGYPILLNGKDSLLTSVSKDITNTQPTTVYMIGGAGVLSANIETQIKRLNDKITIVRLGGKDRYETSMKIIEYFNLTTNTIAVATGVDFPDALSGSVLAARKNCSVLLVDNKNITVQKDLLYTQKITNIIVFGGEGVISKDILTSLKQPISYTYGNTSGNLTNDGAVVSDGQYLYFLNTNDGGKLYKSNLDGSSKSKISDSVCSSLNIVGDWIYYSLPMEGKGLYKMKKDGSSKTLIVTSQSYGIAVVNDWIYFLDKSASDPQENILYKIKTDGTSKTKIGFGTGNSLLCIETQAIVVNENWVYVSLLNKADNSIGLYRIKTDGSTAQKVSSSSPRFYSIEDGWLYYGDDTYQKIYKAKVDGSSEEVLYTIPYANYALYGINASNGYVYFSNYTESQPADNLGIYRMKTDGTDLVKLVGGSARFLNIVSEWIYFEAPGKSTLTYANGVFSVTVGGSSQTMKLKTDGSQLFQAY